MLPCNSNRERLGETRVTTRQEGVETRVITRQEGVETRVTRQEGVETREGARTSEVYCTEVEGYLYCSRGGKVLDRL